MKKAAVLVSALGLMAGALLQLGCSAADDSGAPGAGAVNSSGGASQTAADSGTPGSSDAGGTGGVPGTGGSSGSGAWPGYGGSGGAGGSTNTGGSSGSSDDGGSAGASGSPGTGGSAGSAPGGGGTGGSSNTGGTGGPSANPCDDPSLVWNSANKTNYESYPDPGSDECVNYNGCTWAGQFAYCDDKMPEAWVEAHNIVSVFPSNGLVRHDLCLRSGSKTIVVTAIDTCGDSDCGGCCTENLGDADRLIDIEKYTNERWGVDDGPIEWADLGENPDACN